MPKIKLVSSRPEPSLDQRLLRLLRDVRVINAMTGAEVRGVYDELELARDVLSAALDRADGK